MVIKNNSRNIKDTSVNPQIITSLDLGTSKICSIIASPGDTSNSISILGIGITESDGCLNRGEVRNIDKTVETIERVIEQSQQQSGIEIKDVIVGIAGDHIESFQSKGTITVSDPSRIISKKDVQRALLDSKNIRLANERKIIHAIPQEYIIDGLDGVIDPIGMSGVRMEANVHIVTGHSPAIDNIFRCVEKLNINVKDIVLEPIASSYAVLDDEEKEVGVVLIDIGGGTTDIAIFEENAIRYTKVIALAGKQVTDDIHKILGTTRLQAERIKKEYGHCYLSSIMNNEIFMVPGISGRKPLEVSKSELCQIIQPRMEEIYEFAREEIRRSGFTNRLGAGLVITGGCSMLRGADELAQEIFGMPVKIGIPSGISYSGLAQEVENPIYSTAVGLALYGMKHQSYYFQNKDDSETKDTNNKPKKRSFFGSIKKILEEL